MISICKFPCGNNVKFHITEDRTDPLYYKHVAKYTINRMLTNIEWNVVYLNLFDCKRCVCTNVGIPMYILLGKDQIF